MGSLGRRVGESFGALREVYSNPGLRRVQFAWAGSAIGTYAYSISLAVYAFEHGGATAVGVFMFVRLTIAAAVAPFAASLADRHRREHVMLASDLSRVVTVGGAAACAAAGAPAAVYVLATLTTVLGTVFRPAEASLLPQLARTPTELTAANVSASTLDSLGSFLGPALAAFLLAVSSPQVVFALVAGTFLWSATFVARVHAPDAIRTEEQSDEESEGFGGFTGGVRAIAAEPRLRLLIGLYGAQCLVAGALGVLVVVVALELLDLGNAGVGLLEAASGIGSLLGAALALALVGRRRVAADFALGIVLWGAPLVVLGVVPSTAVAILALGLVGIGNTLVDISAVTLLQRTAPTEVTGRVFGVVESVTIGGLAFGSLAVPALMAIGGARVSLVVVGALLPVLAAVNWRALNRIDEGAKVPEEQLAALRRVPFLAPLPLQSLEFLALRLAPATLAAGETLFHRGDVGDRFYLLRDGSLEIDLPEERKVERAPAFVGEIALLHDIPRTATVRAASDSELWSLEREDFLDTVTSHSRSRAFADELATGRLGAVPVG
jgi:MFS family permease